MENIIQIIVEYIQNIVTQNNMIFSLFLGLLIVVSESIIPMLPLSVFIVINMIAFGTGVGFIISWLGTIIGCTLSYYIFKKLRKTKIKKYLEKEHISKIIKIAKNISFSKLVIILSIPFTPAFSINIAAGLSNMPYKKYLLALIISKIFLVYFWGFVGTTLLESITDINIILKLILMILISFIISKVIIKKFDVR